MIIPFRKALILTVLAGWSLTGARAKDRIDAVLAAEYTQAILIGTFIEDGQDTATLRGQFFSDPWRKIQVKEWLRYPFSGEGPDTLIVHPYRFSRNPRQPLENGVPFLIYLMIIMDSPYGFQVSGNTPSKPLSQSRMQLEAARQVAGSGRIDDWGIVSAGTIGYKDSVVLVNNRGLDLLFEEAQVNLDCPSGAAGFASFTSHYADGSKRFHSVFRGSIRPPLKAPSSGGVLLTDFQVSGEDRPCQASGSANQPGRAQVTFLHPRRDEDADATKSVSLAYRGVIGIIYPDGLAGRANLDAFADATASGAGVDAMGRHLPFPRKAAVRILPYHPPR